MRMNAYYYSFVPTGVEEIDRILSAVAQAGKASHHTDGWGLDLGLNLEPFNGDSLAGYIQRMADGAAKAWREKRTSNSLSNSCKPSHKMLLYKCCRIQKHMDTTCKEGLAR